MNLTTNELINRVNYYTPFVNDVFIYLNGTINPNNPCSLQIKIFNRFNYASFAKPNNIFIFLGSIIDNYYNSKENTIKSIIILTMAHELVHADQMSSMVQYGIDATYRVFIEDQAEYEAEKWLDSHLQEIYTLYGINIKRYLNLISKPIKGISESFNAKTYYLNTLVDIVFRNKQSIEDLNSIFSRPDADNIILELDDDRIMIRRDGMFLTSSIPEFNRIINTSYRTGLIAKKMEINLILYKVKIFDPEIKDFIESIMLKVETSNHTYTPVYIPSTGWLSN